MRKPFALIVVVALVFLAWFPPDSFAVSPSEIVRRIENQHHRIQQGISLRQLTRREADIVIDNLDWIEATFNRMQRDRLLTARELEKLDAMLDRNSRMISRERHDFEYVYWGNFEERIRSQQQRINNGISTRQLTRHEADAVLDNLDWIRATFARMKRDGRLRAREMLRLDEMLDQNSDLIYKKKHNLNYGRFRERYKNF